MHNLVGDNERESAALEGTHFVLKNAQGGELEGKTQKSKMVQQYHYYQDCDLHSKKSIRLAVNAIENDLDAAYGGDKQEGHSLEHQE